MKIEGLYREFIASTGISTDTRKIGVGNIFFALKGPNFNANTFSAKAFEMGAAFCVVDEAIGVVNYSCILVDDVLATLQQLATYHRRQLNIPVIAIAGSNGKTTSKELIHSVLSSQYKTYATQGNLNNHIGVPLTLLAIKKEIEIAVIELGANHIGETALLCEIAQPDFGLVTNNGKDHLEGYGSLTGVRKGNGELYEHLKTVDGSAFVSVLQNDLVNDSANIKRITFGNKNADVMGEIISAEQQLKISFQSSTANKKIEVQTNLVGAYNFENIMAAVAIGKKFNVPDELIANSISLYQPSNNRSQWIVKDGNNFIVDCYNANPSSMELAIENFAMMNAAKKILIIGDMFELGKYSAEEHINIALLAQSKKFDSIIFVGKDFMKANETLKIAAKTFNTVSELKTWFTKSNIHDATILLKASRGMSLEKLLG